MSEVSRRAALAAGAGAVVAAAQIPVAAPLAADPGQTRVATRYAEYLIAKAEAEAQQAFYFAARDRYLALLPPVPQDIVLPNPILLDGGMIHWASQGAISIDEPSKYEPDFKIRYRYAAQPLRDLIDHYTNIPDRVRTEAKRILPLVEAYEAAEAQAHAEAGDDDPRFQDGGPHDLALERKWTAEADVYAEPAETAEDLVLKGRVLQDYIEMDGVSAGDLERFVDQVVEFLSNGAANA